MDLKEELERLRRLKRERVLEALEGKIHRANEFFARKKEHPPSKSIEDVLPGAVRIQTPYGEIVRNTVSCAGTEGQASSWISVPGTDLAPRVTSSHLTQLSRDPGFDNIRLDKIAFIDTETTGLAGGTGTYPFLIGIGYFSESAFYVEQYFMEDYPREPALMHAVAERVNGFAALATYNGKTFDLPLLRTRFIMNRFSSVWEKPHIDLLYLARRLWRKRLADCSLSSIEREILKIERETDIDASFIPRIYFDYARGVRRDMMLLVFAHNAQDVASIAALLVRFAYYLDNPECEELFHAFDLIGLSKIYEMNGLVARAVDCMERALLYAKDDHLSHLISAQIAKIYKRQQRWAEAVEIWHAQIAGTTVFNLEAFVELAKYYEHRERNHHKATEIVQTALQYLQTGRELDEDASSQLMNQRFERMIEDLAYRLNRLRKRLGKSFSQEEE
jgi:uncharacterized protein YprB with RNaseH-like and TPR domain